MKPRVYVETSVISYLTARPSSNILLLARQQFTREFWDLRGLKFEALFSDLVLDEASAGDAVAAAARLAACEGLVALVINPGAQAFAQELIRTGAVPATEPEDALHIALATIHQMDYIASWNFAHLVGPAAKFKLQSKISALGHVPPIIATPEEIFEELSL
jgi:hypothetical protein